MCVYVYIYVFVFYITVQRQGESRGRWRGLVFLHVWRDDTITSLTTAWGHQTGIYKERTDWATRCPKYTENKKIRFTFLLCLSCSYRWNRWSVHGIGCLKKHLVWNSFNQKETPEQKYIMWIGWGNKLSSNSISSLMAMTSVPDRQSHQLLVQYLVVSVRLG